MSVINSMLRDLAANQASTNATPPLSAVPTAVPSQRRWYRPVLGLGLVAVALGIWLLRWHFASPAGAPSAPLAKVMAPSPSAAVSATHADVSTTAAPADSPSHPVTAVAAPTDIARPARAHATIGWELVQPDAESLTAETAMPDPHDNGDALGTESAVDRSAMDAFEQPRVDTAAGDDRPGTAADTPAHFSKEPSQATVAEQQAQSRSEIRAALASRDVAGAGLLLQRARQRWPQDPELQRLQLDWLAQNDAVAAEQEARRLLDEQPDSWSVRQWLGRQLLQQRQVTLARELLAQHAPALDAQPAYHATWALAEQQAGDHPAAIARYRQLQAVQPADGRHSAGLALSLDALHDSNAAAQAWRRALTDPHLPAALRQYGQDRLRQLVLPSASMQVSR